MPSSRRKGGVRRDDGAKRVGADLAMYRKPRLYDVAFGFRDIPAECDGLLTLAARYGMAHPKRVLELACGPAHHLRELARRGLDCHGIDINVEMLAYARELCRREVVNVTLRRGDMRTFRVARRFDIVLCLFDSFAQCTTEPDAIATLRSSARALKRGGLLFVEFTHPSDYFGASRSRTVDRWTQSDGDLTVKARFSITRVDPVAETFIASMSIEPKTENGKRRRAERLEMRWMQRMWMRGGFQYVTLASGAFDLVGWYGDIDPIVPIAGGAAAWRMIAVLRRR
jgi:ubiquinone/menaquinone biosynthesis C-methylase UbiE